jgi:eukaryotic-like serine/threonine-protein kinase
MSLASGTRFGPYEIVVPLGAGGMGEVYRARDTRLDRDVALKILPESFAGDPDRLMRFEREAKALASLNHPHIAAIYGIEQNAIVMELVEGEDLSERTQGMPIEDALAIARQIAEALEAAHEVGIVHRDLKPANIKVRADGTVKVLDFGLAKALDPPSPSATAGKPGVGTTANSPTMTSPAMTAMGLILGTAAYMSPEQAKGRPVDKRADIWAFGAVLYEMLTGRRAFDGDDVQDLLVAVLSRDVDWGALPADTPQSIRTLLRRCLERDPKRRLRDIGEAWLVLSNPGGPAVATPQVAAPFASRSALVLLGVLGAACLALGLLWYRSAPAAALTDAPAVRFPLVSDRALRVSTGNTQPFGVSPDGRTVVFSAEDGTGLHLWVRTIDAVEPRRLEGTQGALQPAISPDGAWVAFVVGNYQIRKMRISGGVVTTVASVDNVTAALTWLSNDEIVFEMIGMLDGIHRVSASGGTPSLLIPLDESVGERSQRRPLALRAAGVVVYTSLVEAGETRLAAFSIATQRRVRLGLAGVQALGLIDDHLIYSREDGVLMAAPFDAAAMQVRGEATQLTDQVERTGTGTPVGMSENGTLVFSPPGSRAARLQTRLSRQVTPIGVQARPFDVARFSPDGERVAVAVAEGDFLELWVFDRRSGEGTRVTSGGYDRVVDWTDDSKALLFLRNWQIWTTPVDRSTPPTPLVTLEGRITAAAVVPGAESVVAVRLNQGDLSGLSVVSIADGTERPLVTQASSGRRPRPYEARVSPDGQWVAFTDRNEEEVHVHAIDGRSGAIQISAEGGSRPVWGPDSRQLFYQTTKGLMMARLETTPSLRVERTPVVSDTPGTVHDVSRKGGAFLIVEPVNQGPGVQVVFGWAADVRRQLRK